MDSTYNDRANRQRRARAEVARVDRDLKKLRAEVVVLEKGTPRRLTTVLHSYVPLLSGDNSTCPAADYRRTARYWRDEHRACPPTVWPVGSRW